MTADPSTWGGWKLRKRTYELTYKPYADRPYNYPVDLETFTSPAAVLDMIAQVTEKTWATNECIGGLVRAINDILRLQGNLCGGGRPMIMDVAKIKQYVRGLTVL